MSDEDVAGRLEAIRETYGDDRPGPVCVCDGYGVRVRVERGRLEIADGIGQDRRLRTFDRATHGLGRLLVLNSSGSVSLDSLRWCRSLGIGVLILGSDGGVDLCSTPRCSDDARLRRCQALAPGEPVGYDIAAALMKAKLLGQARNVVRYFGDEEAASDILGLVDALDCPPPGDLPVGSDELAALSLRHVRQVEATSAGIYWGAWQGRAEAVPRFAARDLRRVPEHWRRFDGRHSVLANANGNRRSERPVNSVLNYLYALGEAECIFACQVVGLDAGLGVVHLDTPGRASLALDLLETIRADIDAYTLDLLRSRSFRRSDFVELRDGTVRLAPPFSHELAGTLPRWAHRVAPWAERVAHMLGSVMDGKYHPATPLTGARTRSAAALVKARKSVARSAASRTAVRQRPAATAPLSSWSCPDCAEQVTNPRHVRCDACIAADPAQTTEVRGRRGAAIASRKRALREWSEAHGDMPYDPEMFRRDIWPRLAGVKLAAIVEVAACSKATASDWRRGKRVPHVSAWGPLATLAGVECPAQPARSLAPVEVVR
ncbi:MAG: CRISPR-associated endonuclease Cas1 [Acidimicrobiales bacterium]